LLLKLFKFLVNASGGISKLILVEEEAKCTHYQNKNTFNVRSSIALKTK